MLEFDRHVLLNKVYSEEPYIPPGSVRAPVSGDVETELAHWPKVVELCIPTDIMSSGKEYEVHARQKYFTGNTFVLAVADVPWLVYSFWRLRYPALDLHTINAHLAKLKARQTKFQSASKLEIRVLDRQGGHKIPIAAFIKIAGFLYDLGFRQPCTVLKVGNEVHFEDWTDMDQVVDNDKMRKLLEKALSTGFRCAGAGMWQGSPLSDKYYDMFDDGEVYELIGGKEDSKIYSILFSDATTGP